MNADQLPSMERLKGSAWGGSTPNWSRSIRAWIINRPQPEHQRRSIVIYQKPSISAAIEAVKAVKGHSKSISNTDSNMPTVAAYEADE
jgi:hypothetical protein